MFLSHKVSTYLGSTVVQSEQLIFRKRNASVRKKKLEKTAIKLKLRIFTHY